MLSGNRLFLIINPVSGTRSKKGLERRLTDGLTKLGFSVDAAFTEKSGDATSLAAHAVLEGYDGVVACGGDGTVNETARAMIGTGVPMGIVPAGSGNGLARHIGIPIDPILSLDVIGQRHVRDCDLGEANGRPFFCTFGVGFDAAVSDRFAASPSRGRITYVRSALQEFRHYHPLKYRITADGELISDEAFLVAVCNAAQYGNNAYIAPDASITDGLLDLVVVHKLPVLDTVLMGVELMAGTLSDGHGIVRRKARRILIERDQDGPAHLDGEPFKGAGLNIDILCQPGRLRMLVPVSKPEFRPVITPIRAMFNDMSIAIKNLLTNKH